MFAGCADDPRPAALAHDPPGRDHAFPAALMAVRVPSGGGALNGVLYVAEGAGPHPTVVLAHGFPGNERNFDLAQVLRRAGWNVLVFHYLGSWGSDGDFSFAQCVEDIAAALAWLRLPDVAAPHRVDPERLALVGHSLGGFAVLAAAAQDSAVRWVASLAGANLAAIARATTTPEAAAALAGNWQGALGALRGTSGELLVREVIAADERWDLATLAPALVRRNVLLVAARRDTDTPPAEHHLPLTRAYAGPGLTVVELDADHAFSQRRVPLAEALLAWLPAAHPVAPAPREAWSGR